MRSSHAPVVAVGAATLLVIVLAGSALGQSPSNVPPVDPATSPAVPGSPGVAASPAAPLAVGPIEWKMVTKGKDFASNPAVYGAHQLPDGRLVVVGSIAKGGGQPVGAAWVSPDGSKWTRLKGLKTPKGSAITAIENMGTTVVATGDAGDRTGLVWTSADGTTWSGAVPLSGVIYEMTTTPTGLVGVGFDHGAAAAWTTTDGVTWQAVTLAPQGYAVHVMTAPDGGLVAAGTIGDDAAGAETPVVWNSPDGITWTQTTLDDLPTGVWSVPAAAATPAGLVVTLSEPGQTGRIGHVWSSQDGLTWTETLVDQDGSFTGAGSVGTEALLIGDGRVLRSADGVTWTPTKAKTFDGWTVRNRIVTLADGRSFAAGDAFAGQGSTMATWTGVPEPLP